MSDERSMTVIFEGDRVAGVRAVLDGLERTHAPVEITVAGGHRYEGTVHDTWRRGCGIDVEIMFEDGHAEIIDFDHITEIRVRA